MTSISSNIQQQSPYLTRAKKRLHPQISSAQDDSLHVVGFKVFKEAVNIPADVLQEAIKRSERAGAIFNNNESTAKNDHKRRQCTLSASKSNKLMRSFLLSVNEFIQSHVSSVLMPSSWVALHSRPGCQDQAAHCDYIPSEELTSATDEEMPLSVIVSLMPETRLNVWPNSIRLVSASPDTVEMISPIPCEVIEMGVGDILVFRGDFIHAGSSYTKDNYRLHAFLDSPSVPRTPNRTWIIHRHGSEVLKKVILPKT
jgi:ectoine hydroxylase-related dioxygenase (phytanoyl-CoA dioxygenase family)